ncbi:AMP-binding protein [Streptomyces sp. NPDC020766]|uniref:AMP-binding protein n=1 Tax=Streptomyces sp. NPDC020766 TaxID=3155011 RepID=UPI0033D28965
MAAKRVAKLLVSRGIRPGDKVALSCPNLPYLSGICFGILKFRAVVALLNAREAAFHLTRSGDTEGHGQGLRRHSVLSARPAASSHLRRSIHVSNRLPVNRCHCSSSTRKHSARHRHHRRQRPSYRPRPDPVGDERGRALGASVRRQRDRHRHERQDGARTVSRTGR